MAFPGGYGVIGMETIRYDVNNMVEWLIIVVNEENTDSYSPRLHSGVDVTTKYRYFVNFFGEIFFIN